MTNEMELHSFDPTKGLPSLEGFDALFVRTVTPLNSNTLAKLPNSLKVIGTASSGSDHIDKEYFKAQGIKVYNAKGCNAQAVGEYVITALLLWALKQGKILESCTVGIVGFGHTGRAVASLLEKFNIPYCSYDPPKELRDPDYTSASISDILNCDLLTLHVPLTKTTKHPTAHFIDRDFLEGNNFELIINASRGGVINEQDLIEAIDNGNVSNVVIDVWENEPDFSIELAKRAFIATPHIAGYTEQAKLNASKLLVEQFGKFHALKSNEFDELYHSKQVDLADLAYSLEDLLTRLNPILEYDAALRDLIGRPDKVALFSKLRTDRPYRYEYPYLEIKKAPQLWRALLNTISTKI